MKNRLLTTTVFIAALFMAFPLEANAQSDRKFNKEQSKLYKKRLKDYKKEGWKIASSSNTLEFALMKHFRTLAADENSTELVGEVSMCKSINVCKTAARNNALVQYAEEASTFVKGRVTSDIFNDASGDVPQEFDKLYAAYERLVSAEIKGELKTSYAIVKENANGQGRSYKMFYIVNAEEASKARVRAMQRAAAETKIAQEYADQVSNFVREGFDD